VLMALIEGGLDLMARDQHQNTALHIAADRGHLDVVRALLQYDSVDPNAKNAFLRTALHNACTKGYSLIV
jgi:ankyrin repeat protein